jgi:hypothetical protein
MKRISLFSALLLFVVSATAQISETEKNDLRFMRQEEKMAHDFYAAMLEKWGGVPFQNIVKAEKWHLQLVKNQLDLHKVADPLAGIEDKRGEFVDANFKKMYDDLLAKGNQSLLEALRGGALIEETDIVDLKTRLNETANAGIRNTYTLFFTKWSQNVFKNIATSEATHMVSMLNLIEKYNPTDPVGANGTGVFLNDSLQALYNTLVLLGDASLVEAPKAGALVEEVDILDLQNAMDKIVDNDDIELVYKNPLAASYNHLNAFVKNMKTKGVTYVPQRLAQAEFDKIIKGGWSHGFHGGTRGIYINVGRVQNPYRRWVFQTLNSSNNAVFFIDTTRNIRLIMYYPLNVGRNMEEIKRVLLALQTADKHKVALPLNWKKGEKIIVPPPKTLTEMEERIAGKLEMVDFYLAKRELQDV